MEGQAFFEMKRSHERKLRDAIDYFLSLLREKQFSSGKPVSGEQWTFSITFEQGEFLQEFSCLIMGYALGIGIGTDLKLEESQVKVTWK